MIIVAPRRCTGFASSTEWGLSVFDGNFSPNEGNEAISFGVL